MAKYNNKEYLITSSSYGKLSSIIYLYEMNKDGTKTYLGQKELNKRGNQGIAVDDCGNITIIREFEDQENYVTTIDELIDMVDKDSNAVLDAAYKLAAIEQEVKISSSFISLFKNDNIIEAGAEFFLDSYFAVNEIRDTYYQAVEQLGNEAINIAEDNWNNHVVNNIDELKNSKNFFDGVSNVCEVGIGTISFAGETMWDYGSGAISGVYNLIEDGIEFIF